MKKALLATVAFVGFSAGAVAADLSARAIPAPFVAATVFTWTGLYGGLNIGGAWEDGRVALTPDGSSFNDPALTAPDLLFLSDHLRKHESGVTGGGQIGYNHQFGAFVLGIEADANAVDLNDGKERHEVFPDAFAGGNAGVIRADAGQPLVYNTRLKSNLDWYGTVRARAGVAFDRALIYATGGFAFGDVTTEVAASVDLPPDLFDTQNAYRSSRSDTRTGWAAGGGLEYALTDNITVKGEYLYVDLDDENTKVQASFATNAQFPGSFYSVSDETKFHVARLGVNFRF